MSTKSFSLWVEDKLWQKLREIAKREGRSATAQVQTLIRRAVNEYESKNGELNGEGLKKEMNTYIVTRTDSSGERASGRYRIFGYAVAQLLHYIYYPENGDYKITFTRETDRNEKQGE